jgi:hypothetical protein
MASSVQPLEQTQKVRFSFDESAPYHSRLDARGSISLANGSFSNVGTHTEPILPGNDPTSVGTWGLFALPPSREEWFEGSFTWNSLELFMVPVLKEEGTVARSRWEFVRHVNLRPTLLREPLPRGEQRAVVPAQTQPPRPQLEPQRTININSGSPTGSRAQRTRRL